MLRLDAVSKRYADGTVAVHDLTLDVARGEVCVLVGPSGCGKTTTMRMVNRLIEPTSGRIVLDGRDVTHVDPVALRRGIGYVIQQVGLFPHQTIEANVATVPALLGWDRARARARVRELLELVGLDPEVYARRYPHELSGGQRQRVGVARALAADPPVLLMDEPFGAVDPIARDRLQAEFLRLQAAVRKTVVFVTHDIEEAVRLGDRIAVLRQGGYLEQYAPPRVLLGAPATAFVADFVGSDRGLKRLAVTPIRVADLEQPPVVPASATAGEAGAALDAAGADWAMVVDAAGAPVGWLTRPGLVPQPAPDPVPVTASLKTAFSRLLQADTGWVAVVDGASYLGVLTPATVHEALRRSVVAETPPGSAP
jgi:osmoprotectant transport system ATP-binding protein